MSGVGACIVWFDGGDGYKLVVVMMAENWMVKESCEKKVMILKKKSSGV